MAKKQSFSDKTGKKTASKNRIKLMQFSSNVISLTFKSGFGFFNVKGFNLFP